MESLNTMGNQTFCDYSLNKQVMFHVYTEHLSPLTLASSNNVQSTKTSWFNRSGLGVRRFDPIYDHRGNLIPCFYGALSCLAVLSESIVQQSKSDDSIGFSTHRSVLNWQPENPIQQQKGRKKGIAQFIPNKQLTLIDLETVATNHCTPIRSWLTQGESAYPALQKVAAWFAHHNPEHHGLTWQSTQGNSPNDRMVVLFGDRVTTADLQLISHHPLNSREGLEQIRETVRALNVRTPEWLIA